MLVYPNKPPKDDRVNGLHIWCLPYLDDILIVTVSLEDCQRKLLRALAALKILKTAPGQACPLAMGDHIPFMIADTLAKEGDRV